MICSNCKKIIAQSSTKCPFCSEPFRENEGVVIKKHYAKRVLLPIGIAVLIVLLFSAFLFFIDSLRKKSAPLQGELFSNAIEALLAYDAYETQLNDTDLDYCPPYELKYNFEVEGNIVIIYSNCYIHGGDKRPDFAVRILRKTDDGKLKFDFGFSDLQKNLPLDKDYYYWTDIHTSHGKKALGIFYLPKGDQRDIYFDGIKAKKVLVSVDNDEFYLCYAVSPKRDTTFKNIFTPISTRHKIELK